MHMPATKFELRNTQILRMIRYVYYDRETHLVWSTKTNIMLDDDIRVLIDYQGRGLDQSRVRM